MVIIISLSHAYRLSVLRTILTFLMGVLPIFAALMLLVVQDGDINEKAACSKYNNSQLNATQTELPICTESLFSID